MTHLCMPFVVVNYGAEMIFILHERLQAQSVKDEKSVKVMQDMAKAMFAPAFVAELLRPQPMYSTKATREIFDRLVHSSIMRLSESSMDKLYDLMTMGCKLKVLSCQTPRDLERLTVNHISSIQEYIGVSGVAVDYVAEAKSQIIAFCQSLSNGQLAEVRHTLLATYQEKRIKVSLFLNEGLQLPDGVIGLPRDGPLPQDPVNPPTGTIAYFDGGAQVFVEAFQPAVLAPSRVQLPDVLGRNLYASKSAAHKSGKETSSPSIAPGVSESFGSQATVTGSPPRGSSDAPATVSRPPPTPMVSSGPPASLYPRGPLGPVSSELQSLAALIGPPPAKEATFKLALFADEADGPSPSGGGASSSDVVNVTFSRQEIQSANAGLMSVLSEFSAAPRAPPAHVASKPPDDGADLLDLMDGA